jgi:uncharacterized protein (DUF433 family)
MDDPLGIGLYSMTDAARLLKTPRRTISRWVEGYVCQLRDEKRRYAPLIEKGEEASLTFGDLVELLYVRGFRDSGVPLDEIRRTAAKYRDSWSVAYPLASKRFATEGKGLLLQESGAWQNALTGQTMIHFEDLGRRLVHVGDLVSEWRPLGESRAVVLNPSRAFGKPIDDVSGAHTFVLAQAVQAGEKPDKVAWWYGTTGSAVLDALEFESQFQAPAARKAA